MSRFSNKLSKAEDERLALLVEEMGEALQVVGKILRHGYESFHPDNPSGPTNREALEKELGDVRYAIELMCAGEDVGRLAIAFAAGEKSARVWKFLHHQPLRLLSKVQKDFER